MELWRRGHISRMSDFLPPPVSHEETLIGPGNDISTFFLDAAIYTWGVVVI